MDDVILNEDASDEINLAEGKTSVVHELSLDDQQSLDIDDAFVDSPLTSTKEQDPSDSTMTTSFDLPLRRNSQGHSMRQYQQRINFIGTMTLALLFVLSFGSALLLKILSGGSAKYARGNGQESSFQGMFFSEISSKGMKNTLTEYTKEPRLAGSQGDAKMASYIRNKALEFGFTEKMVKIEEKSVPLNQVVKIQLVVKQPFQQTFELSVNSSATNFHMFSKNGVAEGKMVYALYGRREDFQMLKSHAVGVENKIVLVRRGKIPLSVKLRNAEVAGAIGVLSYSHSVPINNGASSQGERTNSSDSPWLPSDMAQSDTVFLPEGNPKLSSWDPLKAIPSIPSIPISVDIAKKLMESMKSVEVSTLGSKEWSDGGLTATYHLTDEVLQVQLLNQMEYTSKIIRNVVVTIPGYDQPDRFVIVGSRRDSQFPGAINPGCDVSIFLEILRALGKLKKNDWHPFRTIILISWGAEEFGPLSSTKWFYENMVNLQLGAIVYLNIGASVLGQGQLKVYSTPVLQSSILPILGSIKDPDTSKVQSVLAAWYQSSGKDSTIAALETSSTFSPLSSQLGIPSVEIVFENRNYSVENSRKDSMEWLHKYGDHNFLYLSTMAKIWGGLLLCYSDTVILPFNHTTSSSVMKEKIVELSVALEASELQVIKSNMLESFNKLEGAALVHQQKVEDLNTKLTEALQDGKKIDEIMVLIRHMNSRMETVERIFFGLYNPLPLQGWFLNTMYGPVKHQDYQNAYFPLARNAIFEGNASEVKLQVQRIADILDSAVRVLQSSLESPLSDQS